MNRTIVFGGGCFWCIEAILKTVQGVMAVTPGYAGGNTDDPDYRKVCTGTTGHAEVVKVGFDDAVIPQKDLIRLFFAAHDPTSEDRQGNDVGTQYRSIILYGDDDQKQDAMDVMKELEKDGHGPIVTEIEPLRSFFPAEDYHLDYYYNNRGNPYCQAVISPKLKKFMTENPSFSDLQGKNDEER